jgi:hypothetical protein
LVRGALLSLAASIDEPLEEEEWLRIQKLAARLADVIELDAHDSALIAFAQLWRGHERPPSLN